MVDFRFHVSSLVAIFLALGIGILIGTTLVGDDVLVKEQKLIVDRLEQDFELLREQNRLSQKEIAVFKNSNDNYQRFAQEILPIVLKDRLKGQDIAIVVTNGYAATEGLEHGLKLAGANIVSVSRINSSYNFNDSNSRYLICSKLGIKPARTSSEFSARVAGFLAQAIVEGIDPETVQFLEETGLASLQGSFSGSLDIVIMLGGSQEERQNSVNLPDLPMIDYFLAKGLKVAGTEFTHVTTSYMGLYQSKKIITVDNIDMAPGQVALVFALNGLPGNYGVKSTADDLIPPLENIMVGSDFNEQSED